MYDIDDAWGPKIIAAILAVAFLAVIIVGPILNLAGVRVPVLSSVVDRLSPEEEGRHGRLNPTPTKLNGEPSREFEPEDIRRAEEAPESVREYCAGAVSEAQELGCLSHVSPSDVP